MKLSKKQKELLLFAQSTTLGIISITDSNLDSIAWQLSLKGLFERVETRMPFCSNYYWKLTSKGYDLK